MCVYAVSLQACVIPGNENVSQNILKRSFNCPEQLGIKKEGKMGEKVGS